MKQFTTILIYLLSSSWSVQAQESENWKPPVDGLEYASWEEAGFDSDSIEALITAINTTEHGDFRGMVVIKDQKIVIEEYFNTFWRKSIHDIRSAGKSVTSLLLGVALKEGLIKDLEQDVYSFFPKSKYPPIDEDYKQITIQHLLDMSSGIDADTDRSETPGHVGNWIGLDDWKDYLLSVPLAYKPGKRFVYADINPLLISAIIEEASGLSLKDYAKEKLFDPLGISQFYWYTNAANQTGAAGNLYLSTLDFAKLGALVANEGRWGETQIITTDYTELLYAKPFDISDYWNMADAYGMLWYKATRTFGGKEMNYLFASGNGGNHLVIVPDSEIVIALTSSAYGQRYAQRRSYQIMSKVLSALK